jgi:hypothetical protein
VYALERCEIKRVADALSTPRSFDRGAGASSIVSTARSLWHALWHLARAAGSFVFHLTGAHALLSLLRRPPPKGFVMPPPFALPEVLKESQRRNNQIVSVVLKSRLTSASVALSTYHMPCFFEQPAVMALHVSLAVADAKVRVLCCAVLCCAVLCCAVLCCAVLCCAVLSRAVLCCRVLCCAVRVLCVCCRVLCCAVACCAANDIALVLPVFAEVCRLPSLRARWRLQLPAGQSDVCPGDVGHAAGRQKREP